MLPARYSMFLFLFAKFFFPLLMLFSRLSLTGLPPAPSAMLPQAPQHLPMPQHSSCKFSFFFWLFCICWLSFSSVTCSSYAVPSHCAAFPHFVNPPPGLFQLRQCLSHCTRLSMAQCKFFFFIILPLLTPASLSLHCPFMPHPFPHTASILSCCIPSLMPHPLSCATSVLSCHIDAPSPHYMRERATWSRRVHEVAVPLVWHVTS